MGCELLSYEHFRRQHFALRNRIQKHIKACEDFDTYHKVYSVSKPATDHARVSTTKLVGLKRPKTFRSLGRRNDNLRTMVTS